MAPVSYNLDQEIELLEQWQQTTNGPPGFSTNSPKQKLNGLEAEGRILGRKSLMAKNKGKG